MRGCFNPSLTSQQPLNNPSNRKLSQNYYKVSEKSATFADAKRKTIKFGVYSNPSKDADGKDSYHVRHETQGALNQQYIINHLEHYHHPEAQHIEAVVRKLKEMIVEMLTDNYNVHIEGLGNFYLKLGFRKRKDEKGLEVKPHFTDPAKITGNDVDVESIGFTPDEEFLNELRGKGYHFENATGKGNVGHSAKYTKEQIIRKLDEYFQTQDCITRRQMEGIFGLTKYMAQRWLDELCTMPPVYLEAKKVANVRAYFRR